MKFAVGYINYIRRKKCFKYYTKQGQSCNWLHPVLNESEVPQVQKQLRISRPHGRPLNQVWALLNVASLSGTQVVHPWSQPSMGAFTFLHFDSPTNTSLVWLMLLNQLPTNWSLKQWLLIDSLYPEVGPETNSGQPDAWLLQVKTEWQLWMRLPLSVPIIPLSLKMNCVHPLHTCLASPC